MNFEEFEAKIEVACLSQGEVKENDYSKLADIAIEIFKICKNDVSYFKNNIIKLKRWQWIKDNISCVLFADSDGPKERYDAYKKVNAFKESWRKQDELPRMQ